MASTTKRKRTSTPGSEPLWPTTMRGRMSDGRLLGTDGSVWLYRAVPMDPVMDATTPRESLSPAFPIIAAYEEIASVTQTNLGRRNASKNNYRQTHMLLVNIPRRYSPPPGHPNSVRLRAQFGSRPVTRRILLFGVKLRGSITGNGIKSTVNSIVDTMVSGMAPLSDYDSDFAIVEQAMTRAGLRTPTADDFRLANAWWNHGRAPDAPLLPHADHIHVFDTADSARAAQDAGVESCGTWPHIQGHHAMTPISVRELDLHFDSALSDKARWVNDLLNSGALCVSIRGLVEPVKITTAELRRRQAQYREDIKERYAAGKMERADQEQTEADLTAIGAAYSTTGGPATLTDASIIAFFDGRQHDVENICAGSAVEPASMPFRQEAALGETWLASPIRANPNLHDLPITTIAYSALPSLSRVGDKTGALLGFTERDRQPAYLSHIAAAREDSTPIMACLGSPGSGKLLPLDVSIPTPWGATTMGEIKVGDQVLGRDGRPCNVTFLSTINPTPNLFELTFSDGQKVHADADHQWVVSSRRDRLTPRSGKRRSAVSRYDRALAAIRALQDASSLVDASVTLDDKELTAAIPAAAREYLPDVWSVRYALDFVGCSPVEEVRTVPVVRTVSQVRKTDPVLLWPAAEVVGALLARWSAVAGGDRASWTANRTSMVAAGEATLRGLEIGAALTIPAIIRLLQGFGAPITVGQKKALFAAQSRAAGISPVAGTATTVMNMPTQNVSHITKQVWPADIAFKALSVRLAQRFSDRPSVEAGESVMTTAEMLSAGVHLPVSGGSHADFAVRLTAPLELPEADLLVPPFVLGAWLGDGSSCSGGFTGIDPQITDEIEAHGYVVTHSKQLAKAHYIKGIVGQFRTIGVLNNKHIPMEYLRSSYEQRLALLQGLMDTDGSVDKNGVCELSLCHERLATDALELIRSLGIKANMLASEASYTLTDATTGERTRTYTGTRYRTSFTTDTQVFRLQRKADRMRTQLRETQRWNYITSIEPIASRPGRCIQVDSADHTYLIADFIPTHNTMLMLWLADQWARMGVPQVIFDPKPTSDHSAAVLASGGTIASLDDLITGDGILDPIRSAQNPHDGIEAAGEMLLGVNPFPHGMNIFPKLMAALRIGVDAGADCIGVALTLAVEKNPDLAVVKDAVFELAEASTLFRACVGMKPGGRKLAVGEGITLIKIGNIRLPLPTPGTPMEKMSPPQRIATTVIKMVLTSSMAAMAGRDGVMHLDEAWVVLGSEPAEVDQIGRLARSLRVLPILYTQKCSDAVAAGIGSYISRVVILALEDDVEANAACELAKLTPTPERIDRITNKTTVNRNTLRAMKNPETGKFVRGSVGWYVDLAGRAVTTEIVIPPEFLAQASTNATDMDIRKAAKPITVPA